LIVIIGSLDVGAIARMLNCVIITVTCITPFAVLLGTMSIFSKLTLIISGGQTVYGIPPAFNDLLAGTI
jgi:ribose/xylose/arabinose/galactoside ABC-type transport system permease subunit